MEYLKSQDSKLTNSQETRNVQIEFYFFLFKKIPSERAEKNAESNSVGEPVAGIEFGVFAATSVAGVGDKYPLVPTVGVILFWLTRPLSLSFKLKRPAIAVKKTITTTRPSMKETILLKLSMNR